MIRFFNVLLAILLLLVLLPFLVFIIVLLRLTGEGEVFYRQVRVGLNTREFQVLKFATMMKNSPNMGAGTLTVQNDPRVLPVGKILRKAKLNELPQLVNVLRGEMSFVGPRPLVHRGEANYTDDVSKCIRSVAPGITGLGSLFLRDEESYCAHREDAHDFYREVISPFKADVELWYVKNRSLLLYFKLLALTVVAVVFSKVE